MAFNIRCHIVKNTLLHIAFSAILPAGNNRMSNMLSTRILPLLKNLLLCSALKVVISSLAVFVGSVYIDTTMKTPVLVRSLKLSFVVIFPVRCSYKNKKKWTYQNMVYNYNIIMSIHFIIDTIIKVET